MLSLGKIVLDSEAEGEDFQEQSYIFESTFVSNFILKSWEVLLKLH